MKKYTSMFRIRFIHNLQYRAAAYAGVATQFAWGFLELCAFAAVYRSGGNMPMGFPQLASYIWLQQAFLALFATWFFDEDIVELISSGAVAYELCRPVDLYGMWYTRSAARRVSRVVLRCVPILAVALLLPGDFRLVLPTDFQTIIYFAVSMILGAGIIVAINMLIYISAFYTISSRGVRIMSAALMELLCGAIIPLPFFPDVMRRVLEILPFAAVQNAPLMIYNRQIEVVEIPHTLLLQTFWLIALYCCGKLMIHRALKRVVIQGGDTEL